MEKNDYQNQTYIIEEKTGKIVKVEEAIEKQKKQKEHLSKFSKKAALGVGMGMIVGLFMTNPHEMEQDNQVAIENTLSNEEQKNISTIETMVSEYHQAADESTQKEIMSDMSNFLTTEINISDDVKLNIQESKVELEQTLNNLVQLSLQNGSDKGYYVLKSKEGNVYQLCSDISESNENWQLLGKFGEYDIASELIRYSECYELPGQPIYRQQVRDKNETDGTYGEWYFTDNYFQGASVPDGTETLNWVLQDYNYDQMMSVGYRNLNLYERVNVTTIKGDSTYSIGTDNFIICPGQEKESVEALLGEEKLNYIDNLQSYVNTKATLYQVMTVNNSEQSEVNTIVSDSFILVKRGAQQFPKLQDNQKLILVAKYDNLEQMSLYQKQVRQVTTDGQGNYQTVSDWATTNDYVINNVAPIESIDTRYILVGNLETVLENDSTLKLERVKTRGFDNHNYIDGEIQLSPEFEDVEISDIIIKSRPEAENIGKVR